MIILKLQAGLGNQMFQYAYARALALRSSEAFGEKVDLALDLEWFDQISERDTKREYSLSPFNIEARILSKEEAAKIEGVWNWAPAKLVRKIFRRIRRDVFGRNDYTFYPSASKPRKSAIIEGYYWNSELYFKDHADAIRNELNLKVPLGQAADAMKKKIEEAAQAGEIPVLLHVRRGDYVTNAHAQSFHGAKDASYYDKAVSALMQRLGQENEAKLHFFAVSDDIGWLRQNIIPKNSAGISFPITYVSGPDIKDYEEMHLMSICHHHIIANSTFSWWGAWLATNPNKTVIGPKDWVADPKVNTKDVLPESWMRI